MAKGDQVDFTVATPDGSESVGIAVRTAGRSLRRTSKTEARARWISVEEVNRNGKLSGDRIMVRMDAILSMREHYE